MTWDYLQPVKILFGNGRMNEIDKIAKEYGFKRGLLVCGNYFRKHGIAQEIIDKSNGVLVDVFSDVSPNPETVEVNRCTEKLREINADFILAAGGGSVMDCAKAASCMALCGDNIEKYHGTGVPVPAEHLPVIAVPTTSGTGSEVTCVSVLSNHALGKKGPIVSNSFYPVAAIIDPTLTYTTPKQVTASCGIDVLCHAVEGFWSKNHQPICDALALHATRLVFQYLQRAYDNPTDAEAREKMSEASVIAGLAFTLPKTTASHACSFPLTNFYKIPHGEACGLTLDYFARINRSVENYRLDTFSQQLGFKDGEELADKIAELKKNLNLRTDIKDLKLSEEELHKLAKASLHPNILNNPVEITEDMLYEMYVSMC